MACVQAHANTHRVDANTQTANAITHTADTNTHRADANTQYHYSGRDSLYGRHDGCVKADANMH